jgi:aminoglycoside phosphotransferase (APT) family kinase protein
MGEDRSVESTRAIGGHRLRWPQLPHSVRAQIERAAGAAVVATESRDGGFSPGLASILRLADGRSAFAKAISRQRNDFTYDAIRREAAVLAGLPATVPAPRPLGVVDDGEWIALITTAVDGHNPLLPWRRADLDRFLAAPTVLAQMLTPAPLRARGVVDEYDEQFTRWAPHRNDERLTQWQAAHADRLAGLERGFAEAVAGDTLLHGDLRSDNFLLTGEGFVVVDWPSVVVGVRWFDLVMALPSVSMHGGGDPDGLWRSHPLARGVDPDAVNSVLAGAAGFFIERSWQPAPPLLPTIRQFQRAQGMSVLRWLAGRLGWSPPD